MVLGGWAFVGIIFRDHFNWAGSVIILNYPAFRLEIWRVLSSSLSGPRRCTSPWQVET